MNASEFSRTARFESSGLHFSFTDRADDGVLDDFFPAYNRAFVLENEKERVEGFRDCLALNDGNLHRALSERYGPFCELVVTARSEPQGPVVGGANLLVAQLPGEAGSAVDHSINLNYLFVVPEARGRSLANRIQHACFDVAASLSRTWGAKEGRGVAFLEVNDPFRLTPEEYRLDTEHAGIDQVARLAYWARVGARVLDWPYVQPALSAEQGDDNTLSLAAIGAPAGALASRVLAKHLERFFAISVLKGRPLSDSPSATGQLKQLARLEHAGQSIGLLDLADRLSDLERLLHVGGPDKPRNLPEALKKKGAA